MYIHTNTHYEDKHFLYTYAYIYMGFVTQALFFELSHVHSVTLYYNFFSLIIFTFSF